MNAGSSLASQWDDLLGFLQYTVKCFNASINLPVFLASCPFGNAAYNGVETGAIAAACLARRGLEVALIDPGPRQGPMIGETLPAIAAEMLARRALPGSLDDPRHVPISGTVSAWDGPPVTEAGTRSVSRAALLELVG